MRCLNAITIKWALSKKTRMLVALRGMHGVGLVASNLWRFPTARLHEYPRIPACNSLCDAAGTGVMTFEPTMFGRCACHSLVVRSLRARVCVANGVRLHGGRPGDGARTQHQRGTVLLRGDAHELLRVVYA